MNYTETLPEELKAKKLNGMASTTRKNKPSFTSALWKREDITNTMPMFNAAMRNWKVHHSFVDKYLKVIYPNDAAISSDTALYRFWHSIDTWNRHMDVCLCKMDSDVFFTEGQWPAFETSKTCLDLLNFVNEGGSEGATGTAYAHRREQWCKRDSNERKNQFHNWLESECIKQQKGTMKTEWDSEGCHEEEIGKGNEEEECLSYENFHMRSDMDLPSTITRSTLVDVLTKFIYEVTLGHEMAADNIPCKLLKRLCVQGAFFPNISISHNVLPFSCRRLFPLHQTWPIPVMVVCEFPRTLQPLIMRSWSILPPTFMVM